MLAQDWHDFFEQGQCLYKTYRNDLVLSQESFVGLALSRSWTPRAEDEDYQAFLADLIRIFQEHQQAGKII